MRQVLVGVMAKCMGTGIPLPGKEFCIHNFLAMGMWTSYCSSLALHFASVK